MILEVRLRETVRFCGIAGQCPKGPEAHWHYSAVLLSAAGKGLGFSQDGSKDKLETPVYDVAFSQPPTRASYKRMRKYLTASAVSSLTEMIKTKYHISLVWVR